MKWHYPFCIIFLFCLLPALSQDIEPVVQSSHSDPIQFYGVNYDKNLLMTADKNEVMLWNVHSGKQLRRIASPSEIRGAALCTNGEEVAVISYVYGQDAALRIYSSRTGKLLSTVSFAENNPWGGISYKTLDELVFDNKYNRVAIRYFNEVTIVDIGRREKVHYFKLRSFDHKLVFTDEKNTFAEAYREEKDLGIALLDTLGNVLRSTIVSRGRKQAGIINDHDQQHFYMLDDKGVVHVMNKELEKIDSVRSDSVESVPAYSPPRMALSRDGKKLLLSLHRNQYLYDLGKKQWQVNKWKWIYPSTGMVFASEKADRTVVIRERYSDVIDTETGEEIHSLNTKTTRNNNVRFSPSGRMMSTFHSSTVSKYTTILDLKTVIHFCEE